MDTKVFKQAVRAVGVGQWAWHACVWLVEGWQKKKKKKAKSRNYFDEKWQFL